MSNASVVVLRFDRAFDSDAQRHCAAKRSCERTPPRVMPLRAGQLQRLVSCFEPFPSFFSRLSSSLAADGSLMGLEPEPTW
jgi:hypothetical protein